jgi:hypothetical protein
MLGKSGECPAEHTAVGAAIGVGRCPALIGNNP